MGRPRNARTPTAVAGSRARSAGSTDAVHRDRAGTRRDRRRRHRRVRARRSQARRRTPRESELVTVFDPDTDRASSRRSASAADGAEVQVAASAEGRIEHDDVSLVIVATPHRELPALAWWPSSRASRARREARRRRSRRRRRIADAAARAARVGAPPRRLQPPLPPAVRSEAPASSSRAARTGASCSSARRYGHGGRLGYEREWRADAEVSGGGELIDQGIHLVDLTRFLAGDVTLAFSDLRTTFWPMDGRGQRVPRVAVHVGSASPGSTRRGPSGRTSSRSRSCSSGPRSSRRASAGATAPETCTLYEMLPEMGPPLEHAHSNGNTPTTRGGRARSVSRRPSTAGRRSVPRSTMPSPRLRIVGRGLPEGKTHDQSVGSCPACPVPDVAASRRLELWV